MIYGNLIQEERNNNDAILEALKFIEEDYSQLLEDKSNEILNENYIYLNEEYKEFNNTIKQFGKDMSRYRKEYKQAVKLKDKNKINDVIKGMRTSIRHARYVINNSDTDSKEVLLQFNHVFSTILKSYIPTFLYAASIYGVNINPKIKSLEKFDKTGIMSANAHFGLDKYLSTVRSLTKLKDLVKKNELKKSDILESFNYRKRAMLKYLNDFDRIVSRLEVKSEKDLK